MAGDAPGSILGGFQTGAFDSGPRSGKTATDPLGPFDPDSTAAPSVITRHRTCGEFVHDVAAGLAGPDRGLAFRDLVEVNDGLLSVATDAVDGRSSGRRMPRRRRG